MKEKKFLILTYTPTLKQVCLGEEIPYTNIPTNYENLDDELCRQIKPFDTPLKGGKETYEQHLCENSYI